MLTATDGINVIVAEADLVVSCRLVAVTVTVCCAATLTGAAYRPGPLMVPAPEGEMVQVTPLLLAFPTVAENDCV
jgi:hypothetical protein